MMNSIIESWNTIIIFSFIFGYFLGSIPFGLIVTNFYGLQDIRKTGSGNIGATNVLRTGKKGLALITLILDFLKGYLSILLTSIYLLKSNSVKFFNCKIRSFSSLLSRFNIRSVPNFSTQNEAKAEP